MTIVLHASFFFLSFFFLFSFFFLSRVQVWSATPDLKNTWFGVMNPSRFLGRLFKRCIAVLISCGVIVVKSRSSGKYWRIWSSPHLLIRQYLTWNIGLCHYIGMMETDSAPLWSAPSSAPEILPCTAFVVSPSVTPFAFYCQQKVYVKWGLLHPD